MSPINRVGRLYKQMLWDKKPRGAGNFTGRFEELTEGADNSVRLAGRKPR